MKTFTLCVLGFVSGAAITAVAAAVVAALIFAVVVSTMAAGLALGWDQSPPLMALLTILISFAVGGGLLGAYAVYSVRKAPRDAPPS